MSDELLTYEDVGSALAEHIHRLAWQLTKVAKHPDDIGPGDHPSEEVTAVFSQLVEACAELDRLTAEHIAESN